MRDEQKILFPNLYLDLSKNNIILFPLKYNNIYFKD